MQRIKRTKKRRRLKKKFVVLWYLILLVIFINSVSIIFVGKKNVDMEVNTEFTNKVKTYFFFKNVSDKIKIEHDIDNTKLGDYEVTYSYKKFIFSKKKKGVVSVKDTTKPEIKLLGEEKMEVFLNDKYNEPGYEVKDNYDKEIEVTVSGEVDTSKTGDYYLVYKAKDSNNNETEKVRKVTVSRVSPLSLSVKDFDLTEYFPDIIMKKTKDMGEGYFDDMILAGDSVIWQFGLNYVYPSNKVWAKPCEGPFNFNSQKVYINNSQSDYTLADLIKEKKPKLLMLHMGVCDCNNNDAEAFVKAYDKVFDYIEENSPDTKLVVLSLVPQTGEYYSWIPLRNNTIINKYNYYLADLCKKRKIPFMNVAEVLKNSNGQGDVNLYFDDAYHPNVRGMNKMLDYIRTHGIEED